MHKTKILWISREADFKGGCESYIYQTARRLAEKGYHNTLLYEVDGWTDPAFLKIFDGAFPQVVLSRQIKEINPDLIYVHRLKGKKPILELLGSGIPVIRFFHDHRLFCLREHKYRTLSHATCTKPIGFRCYPCLGFINKNQNGKGLHFTSLLKLKSEQNANKKLSGFVVASDYMKQHLIDHGFQEEKIKVIPLYSWKEIAVEDSQTGDYLLFAGQILRGKGIDILLRALKLTRTAANLIIAGSGKQEAEYKLLAKKLGLSERVKFIGYADQEKMKNLYKNCLMVIMPSRVPETFGLSGLEAMSWSKPVIASEVGGITQWLKNGENGYLFPSNDKVALASLIDKLISDKENARQMGIKGREIYEQNFGADKHLQALEEYFKKIIREAKNV